MKPKKNKSLFDKLNSVKNNLLYDLVFGFILAIMVAYNIIHNRGNSHFEVSLIHQCIIAGLFILLGMHGLFMLFLSILSLLKNKILKAGLFLLACAVLYIGLYTIAHFYVRAVMAVNG